MKRNYFRSTIRPSTSLPSLQREHEIYSILKTVEEHRSSSLYDGEYDVDRDLIDGQSYSEDEEEIVPKELREYKTLHFPSGDLFSGHVHVSTGEMIYGRLTCTRDMEVYEGPFLRGKRHGDGTCIKIDNSGKFLGRYADGMMAEGTLCVSRGLPSDFTYTGSFLHGDFHGMGKIATHNGSIYQGMFERGLFHGSGTLRMVHDAPPGEETADKEESVYTGDFCEGLFHGSGTMVSPDLSSYAGTWHHGEKLEGTETFANGDVFEGSFSNGRRDGMGVLKLQNGRVTKRGMWKGNHLKEDVDVRINYTDGEYTGEHVSSRPHGFGEMEYANFGSGAVTYTGQFLNGFRHGEGRALFHNSNEEYEGTWVCDEPTDLRVFQHNGPLSADVKDICDDDLIAVFSMPLVDRDSVPERTTLARSGSQGSDNRTQSSGEQKNKATNTGQQGGVISDVIQVSIVPADQDEADQMTNCLDVASIAPQADQEEVERITKYLTSSVNQSMTGSVLTFISTESSSSTKRSKSPRPVQIRRTGRRRSFKSAELEGGLDMSLKSMTMVDFGDKPPEVHHYANGDVFHGHLDHDNLRQGSGIYTEHRMGSTYEGDWKNSMRHGVGLLTLSSGVEYCGEFYDDSIHGEGVITLIDDSVYTGGFRFGLFHGIGTLEDESSQCVYVGSFEDGLRHGHGRETFSDGSVYIGEYQKGKRHGTGVLNDSKGKELYRGEWHEDLKQGKGQLFYHKHQRSSWGGSYEGDFHGGKFCGMGCYSYTDGTSIEGQWVDGVPRDGDWTIDYPDGSKYYGFATFTPEDSQTSESSVSSAEGCLRVPLPHGFGTLTYTSGQRYVGSFSYGEYQK